MDTDAAVQNCQQITIQGCQADFYVDGKVSILTWENKDGVLFWLEGTNVDAASIKQAAESIQLYSGEAVDYSLSWLPAGYSRFDRAAVGGTVQELWVKNGVSLSWLYTSGLVALPEGVAETVTVNGTTAQYWNAKQNFEDDSALTVNGKPVDGDSAEASGGTVSGVTIPAAKTVNTLIWTNAKTGVTFRLQGTLDKSTLIRIAENTK